MSITHRLITGFTTKITAPISALKAWVYYLYSVSNYVNGFYYFKCLSLCIYLDG